MGENRLLSTKYRGVSPVGHLLQGKRWFGSKLEIGKPAAVRRKTHNAVDVIDQPPGRAAEDGHDIQCVCESGLRSSSHKVEVIAIPREGDPNVLVGKWA
jgi:hypothetical protein